MWPGEEIPNEHSVFMRVHKNYLNAAGELIPGVFRDQGAGMSTDWEKYSTAEETRARSKSPLDNGVIKLSVGSMRLIEGLTVEHEPIEINRAHSEVFGQKTPEARVKLLRLAQRVIL